MRTSIEDEAVKIFDMKYGNDFVSRISKLKEEVNELFEACKQTKTVEDIAHIVDECSDVQGVLTHIHSVLGRDNDKALLDCIIKNKCREIDTTYLKSKKQ